MSRRTYELQSLYLLPEQARLLDELARESRIPKARLAREAIDMLLTARGKLPPKREAA